MAKGTSMFGAALADLQQLHSFSVQMCRSVAIPSSPTLGQRSAQRSGLTRGVGAAGVAGAGEVCSICWKLCARLTRGLLLGAACPACWLPCPESCVRSVATVLCLACHSSLIACLCHAMRDTEVLICLHSPDV